MKRNATADLMAALPRAAGCAQAPPGYWLRYVRVTTVGGPRKLHITREREILTLCGIRALSLPTTMQPDRDRLCPLCAGVYLLRKEAGE